MHDFGRLDEAGTSAVVKRLNRDIEGCFKQLSTLDENKHYAAACQMVVTILKSQEALAMMAAGRYLAVEPVAMPTKSPPGINPMLLFSAASIKGAPVGVLFPVTIQSGSSLEAAMAAAEEALAMDLDKVISLFNGLPIEERTRRVHAFVAAEDQIDALMKAEAAGQITREVMRERIAPLLARQRPRGTTIDQATMLLRRS